MAHSSTTRGDVFRTDKPWLDLQYHSNNTIMKPHELKKLLKSPPGNINEDILDRVLGSIQGMAMGDALGAHVEFRPEHFLRENPVRDLQGGGTWGLKKGEFTDDTSMALCLANSLIARRDFIPYDQLVRYKWWFREGYMSSIGNCFDIGAATKRSLIEFEHRQQRFLEHHKILKRDIDFLADRELLSVFNVDCSDDSAAGNGALMRLSPVPLFFRNHPSCAVEFSGASGKITHGGVVAYDACRYYGALIIEAVRGGSINELLDVDFYSKHEDWFSYKPLHADVMKIMKGSYRKPGGHKEGIRGKGYIIQSLEAALWAFWKNPTSFEDGVLAAVNLGDDTDTTAAIYGQLAGAYHGYKKLPDKWKKDMYATEFIRCLSEWIVYEGERWDPTKTQACTIYSFNPRSQSNTGASSSTVQKQNPKTSTTDSQSKKFPGHSADKQFESGSSSSRTGHSTSTTSQEGNSKSSSKSRHSDNTNTVSNSNNLSGNNHASTFSDQAQSPHDELSSEPGFYIEHLATCNGVCRWLGGLGNEFRTYMASFEHHNIDGFWLLNYVNDESLIKYNVTNDKHRKEILDAIQVLKHDCTRQRSAKKK